MLSRAAIRTCITSDRGREVVGEAYRLLPERLVDRVGGLPPVWEGGDPRFAGLYEDGWGDPGDALGRMLLEKGRRPGMMYLHTGASRATRPRERHIRRVMVGTVLHEFGHFVEDRLITPHRRKRVYTTPADPHTVLVRTSSGLLPGSLRLNAWAYNLGEQIAEAVRLWLSPSWAIEEKERGDAAALYQNSPRGLDDWCWHFDNRRLLALLNELAGWPADQPPRSMR